MPYKPDEVARPRTTLSQMSDEGGLGIKIARQGVTAPIQILEGLASIPGLLTGGIGFAQDASNKALGIRNQDVSYEQLSEKAFKRLGAPVELASEYLPFGQEAAEAMNDTIGTIFNYMTNKGKEYGDKNLEATNSPLMATIAHTSFEGLPYLGAEALGVRAVKGAAGLVKEGIIPRVEDMVPTAKEFRNQLAAPKTPVAEVIPPTRYLNSQHLDLPETSNIDAPTVTRENFADNIKKAFGLSDEHASAVRSVVEARARNWANTTGYLPQDYYPQYFQEITAGGKYGPGALFQRDPEYAATWYSHLEKTVEGSKFPNKAPGADMAKALESWAAKGDIKPEELAWTGTAEWLKQQKGTVTKQQVLEHIRQNRLEIKELNKGNISIYDYAIEHGFTEDEAAGIRVMADRGDIRAQKLVNDYEFADDGHRTKFGTWRQKGGDNYRELLLTIPNNKLSAPMLSDMYIGVDLSEGRTHTASEYWHNFAGIDMEDAMVNSRMSSGMKELHDEFVSKNESVTTFPGTNAAIIKMKSGKYRVEQNETDSGIVFSTKDAAERHVQQIIANEIAPSDFVGSHWDEPNVIAHTRLTDRIDPDGKKVLFVEEIQSDWHQGGREGGYVTPELTKTYMEHQKMENLMYDKLDEADALERKGDKRAAELAREHAEEIKREKEKYFEQVRAYNSGVPNAPMKSTKAWSMLAMKRLVRYAAEHGYDKVAWTTGEQQNKLYSLSSHIEELAWNKDRWGNYTIQGRAKDGGRDFAKTAIPDNDLEGLVGKEIAEKIRAKEVGTLRGIDLEVGGGGMRGFYDEILPNETKRMFGKKQWGNAELGKTTLDFTDPREMRPRYEGPDYTLEQIKEQAEMYSKWSKKESNSPEQRLEDAHVARNLFNTYTAMNNYDMTFKDAIRAYGSLSAAEALGGTIKKANPTKVFTDVHSMVITPEMKQKALSEGMPLFSKEGGRIKGSTEILANGKAIIRAYQGANVRTALHEVGHVFRSEIGGTNPKLLAKIAKDFGAKDGWSVRAEEDFTDAFLKWLEDGRKQNAMHETMFTKFKKWLATTYSVFASKAVVSDNIKDFFDNTLKVREIEAKAANAKTMNMVFDKYAPDDDKNATYITTTGKPVGDVRQGGHASTVENITAEMGWHDLYLDEDLGRGETTRRAGLITRVSIGGQDLFISGKSVMPIADAKAGIRKFITNAGIADAVLDYDGNQVMVKAGKVKTPKPKVPIVKGPKAKVVLPVKESPLIGTISNRPIRDVLGERAYKGTLIRAAKEKTELLARKWAADLKKDIPDNVHYAYRAVIDTLRDGIDPTFKTEKRIESLKQTEKFLRKNPEMMHSMPARVLKVMNKKTIKDMTLEELYDIHQQIYNQENGLIKLGQLKYKLEEAQKTRARELVVGGIDTTLGKSKAGKSYVNPNAISSPPLAVKKQTALDRIRAGRFGTLIPQQVFDILDGGANFEGTFHNLLYRNASKAYDYELTLIDKSIEGAEKLLKDIHIRWTDWERRTKIADMELSRADMLQVYLGWKNPTHRQALQDAGITNAKAQMIMDGLSRSEKKMGDYILDDNAKSAPLIDKVYQAVENKSLVYEPNYSTMAWEGDGFNNLEFADRLKVEMEVRQMKKSMAPTAPFLSKRIGVPEGEVKLKMNAIENWLKHVVQRSHYIANAVYVKEMGKVFSDPRVVAGVREKFGQPAVDYIRNYLEDIANPARVRGMKQWEQMSRVLRRNAASAYIAANPSSVLIQMTALPKYLKDAGAVNVMTSLAKFVSHAPSMYKRICAWEPQIKNRFFEREAAEVGEMRKTHAGRSITALQSGLMLPTNLMDRVMLIVGYDAVYKRYLPKVGHEAAKAKALDVSLRINAATHVKDQAPMYKSNEISNWILQFTNDLNKTWGEMIHTLPADLRAGRFRDAAYTMTGFSLMALLAWSIAHKDTPDSSADIADAFTEQSLASLPAIGSIAMAKKAGFEDSGNIALNAMALPGDLLSDQSNSSKAKKSMEAIFVLFGLPYSFTRKTALAIKEEDASMYFGKGRPNTFETQPHKRTGRSRRSGRQFLR